MGKRYTNEELKEIEKKFEDLIHGQKYCVLVVDPSTAFRKTLVNAFIKNGAEYVHEAKDCDSGVNEALKSDRQVIAFVELNMPRKDGLRFLQEFRKHEKLANGHVVFISMETNSQRVMGAVKSGAAGFIKKPFEPQGAIDKVNELTTEKKKEALDDIFGRD